MQRRMQEMSDELAVLRTAVRQTEVKSNLDSQRNAARDPLTFDEKKILISQIQKLPADKMDQVVEIVQAAIKPGQRGVGNEEIEIPLDELDTLTLRKLQKYVEDCNRPKKRPSAPLPRATSNIVKKQRIDRSSMESSSVYQNIDEGINDSVDYPLEEELLFDTHTLEEEGVNNSHTQVMDR